MRKKEVIKILGLAFVVFFATCCNSESRKTRLEYISLSVEARYNQFNDTTFVTDGITEIAAKDGRIFINDAKLNKSLILNNKFEVQNYIERGYGPEEILGANFVQFENESLFVFDNHKLQVSQFDLKGRFQRKMRPKDTLIMLYDRKPAIFPSGEIFAPSLRSDKPIVHFDKKIDIVKTFGTVQEFENYSHHRSINSQNILALKDGKVASVWSSRPFVQLFSSKGEVLDSLDLSEFLGFRSRVYDELLKQNPRRKYTLQFDYYRDITSFEDTIYLLFIGNNKALASNEIIVINAKGDKLTFDRVLKLDVPNSFFYEIAVDENILYAFEKAGAELMKFQID